MQDLIPAYIYKKAVAYVAVGDVMQFDTVSVDGEEVTPAPPSESGAVTLHDATHGEIVAVYPGELSDVIQGVNHANSTAHRRR